MWYLCRGRAASMRTAKHQRLMRIGRLWTHTHTLIFKLSVMILHTVTYNQNCFQRSLAAWCRAAFKTRLRSSHNLEPKWLCRHVLLCFVFCCVLHCLATPRLRCDVVCYVKLRRSAIVIANCSSHHMFPHTLKNRSTT